MPHVPRRPPQRPPCPGQAPEWQGGPFRGRHQSCPRPAPDNCPGTSRPSEKSPSDALAGGGEPRQPFQGSGPCTDPGTTQPPARPPPPPHHPHPARNAVPRSSPPASAPPINVPARGAASKCLAFSCLLCAGEPASGWGGSEWRLSHLRERPSGALAVDTHGAHHAWAAWARTCLRLCIWGSGRQVLCASHAFKVCEQTWALSPRADPDAQRGQHGLASRWQHSPGPLGHVQRAQVRQAPRPRPQAQRCRHRPRRRVHSPWPRTQPRE